MGASQLHSCVAAGAAITITFSNLCVFMLYPLIISTHDHRRLKSGLISLHSSAGPPEVLSLVAPQTVNVCEHFLLLQRRFYKSDQITAVRITLSLLLAGH